MLIAILIVSSILGFLILSLYFRNKLKYDYISKENNIKIVHVKHSLYEVKDESCKIPKLDIWNSLVRWYFRTKIIVYCGIEKNDWLYFDSVTQELKVSNEIREYENSLNCTIKYITRINETHTNITYYGYHKFPITNLKSDFFDVECNINGTDFKWSKYFMRAIINNEKIKKLKKKKKPKNWTGWNVHIISYGSLSQMAFKRLLPNSLKFFEKTLNGIIMEGYNALGNDTLQSFIPILTGINELELSKIKESKKKSIFIENIHPFIWKNFSDAGYVTLFGEDAFKNATFFNYFKGFKNQPTDHFPGTSFHYTEKVFGNDCFREKMQHKEWLDYSKSFIEAYNFVNISRFSFLHHSSLSKNHFTKAENIDDDLLDYFKYNYKKGNFKNDFIILMSDHGYTSPKFRNTQQGRLEERLPLLAIRLPEKFNNSEYKKKLLSNLNLNRNILITPFDIYTTLLDVLSLPNDYKLNKSQSLKKRSLSIIKPINKSRDCLSAQIERHWCTCMEWKNISHNKKYTSTISVLVNKYIKEMNKFLLSKFKHCSSLYLKKIVDAQWLVPNDQVLSNNDSIDTDDFISSKNNILEITEATYKIKFTAQPSGAIYMITTHLNFVDTKMYVNMWNHSSVNSNDNVNYCMEKNVYKLLPNCICYDKLKNKH